MATEATSAESRQSRTISLTTEAAEALAREWPLTGMKQKELLSRLVEFFAALDRPGQQLITGSLPREYVEDASERLRERAVAWIQNRHDAAGLPGTEQRPPPEKGSRRAAS